MARHKIEPITFFLNETHELSPLEKPSGGRLPQYAPIPWTQKATQLSDSLETVRTKVAASHDPLKEHRYFVMAVPEPTVQKLSTDKRKAPAGVVDEATEFSGQHGKVFDRLGLDLLQVTDDGKAVVHADRERFDQLAHRSEILDALGAREQARWATIHSFETVPLSLRVDDSWLHSLSADELSDLVIELQPVLTRTEAETVLRAISDLLAQTPGELLTGTGTDYSGRHWFRGKAKKPSIRKFARDFYSIQAIHPPLYSVTFAKSANRSRAATQLRPAGTPPPNVSELPCVAVLDLGVPADHNRLSAYRRGRFYLPQVPRAAIGNHGSLVASRVVFGDCQSHGELLQATGRCAFYDVMVGEYPFISTSKEIDDKVVLPALNGTRAAADDVRVFNLSFGDEKSVREHSGVTADEKRRLIRDLDNFVFENDCIVVVAAGNSRAGVLPDPPYPDHYKDSRWGLGPWACGYNTLVCGSFVSAISIGGFVQSVGWPSQFTRIGPGWNEAPVPSFSAPGGSGNNAYQRGAGHGVWALSSDGLAEDHSGTSFAAPLLAREAALLLHALQEKCSPGTRPFAVTARAFLTLTATPPVRNEEIRTLVERTLGVGQAIMHPFVAPKQESAVFLWQGYIDSPRDTIRVQLPIPLSWLSEAGEPVLRLVVCSDPPVNDSLTHWVCRRVNAYLRPGPDAPALRHALGEHKWFPVIDREYALEQYKPGATKGATDNMWMLEFSYDETGPYLAATDFDPRHRVAFAAELVDRGANLVSPQEAIQALPIATTMNRLSIQPTAVRTPIIVKTRV